MTNSAKGEFAMKSWVAIVIIAITLPVAASAEEKKSFWAKLLPDNSSALTVVDDGKAFFGQLFEDSKKTGKAIVDTGKDVIEGTGKTIKSLTTGE